MREIRYGERELPAALSLESPPDRATISVAIQSALSQAGINVPRVVAALPRRQVTIKLTNLPKAEREAMRRMLAFEAQQHVPLPLDQVVLDFQVLGAAPGGFTYRVDTGTAGRVNVVVVPEASGAILGVALAGVLMSRRRARRER